MTTTNSAALSAGLDLRHLMASAAGGKWHDFWHSDFGETVLSRGLSIVLLLIGATLAARFISWVTGRISHRIDAGFRESDALVRSESAKHRQAVASVVSYVAIALLGVMVVVEVTDILRVPVSSLVAPAAVIGAALGFGAQRIVQDLLAGFFIITEKQYGFGDLVELTLGTSGEAMGTVEDVTLRVTKLRTADGELYTISNGQIFKTLNLSKEWARAVIDIPVPGSADLNVVNDVLHHVCEAAPFDPELRDLLLDKPQVMGVESIEVGTVNLRMVARTLPGKQFEVGRRLRLLVVGSLARAGIATSPEGSPVVGALVHPATVAGAERETQGPARP
jgi:small conductance mechanosensitive channel